MNPRLALPTACVTIAVAVLTTATRPAAAERASKSTTTISGLAAPSGDPQYAADRKFRAEVGLDDSDAHIAEVHGRETAGDRTINEDFAVPLTADETSELDARTRTVTDDKSIVEQYFSTGAADQFAGMYMDHANGGKLHVLTTGDPDRVSADLRSRVKHPDRLLVSGGQNTSADIRRTYDYVSIHMADYAKEDVVITSVIVDEPGDTVVVGLSTDLDAGRRRIAEDVPSGSFRVERAAAPSPTGSTSTKAPPMAGGLIITDTSSSPNEVCTSGALGVRSTVPTTYYALAAGHCGRTADNFVQGTYQVGHLDLRSTTNYDVERTPLATQSQHSNLIYLSSTSTRSILSSQSQNADTVGDLECFSGIQEPWSCGTLQSKTASYSYYDSWNVYFSLVNQRIASVAGAGGDSGAPVFLSNQLTGIMDAVITSGTYAGSIGYNQAYDVVAALGLNGILTY